MLISTIWPQFEVTPEREVAWGMLCADVDYKAATNALMALGKSSKFPPSLAELIDTIQEQTGTKRMSASEAWLIAMPLCSRYTTREQLEKLDPDIRKALNDAGHASYLGTLDEEQARRAFMGAWKAMGESEEREQVKRIGGGMKQIGG